MNPSPDPIHVLVVEDEEALRKALARILERNSYRVTEASDGREALHAVAQGNLDVVVSDISMPGIDGIQLLRAIRERDLDVPVILVTANPTVETATQALEYGALRYLIKPMDLRLFLDAVARASKFNRIARLKREAVDYLGADAMQVGDRAGLEASLARGLDSLWMAYQPLVDPRKKEVFAYEALVRTREPTIPHPGALFSVAERLGRVYEIGRAIRAHIASTLAERSPPGDMFINLHPSDLFDGTLFSPNAPLAPFADRIVFEITERAAFEDGAAVPEQVRRLRALGYRIAIDDLGAGYAGLNYFALLTPEVVKLDVTLVRNVHLEKVKRKIIGSMTSLCKDLGMTVIAEGVETAEERDVILELGCDFLQGFFFARPGPPFPEVEW